MKTFSRLSQAKIQKRVESAEAEGRSMGSTSSSVATTFQFPLMPSVQWLSLSVLSLHARPPGISKGCLTFTPISTNISIEETVNKN
jgi:hypothetical protein